MAYLSGMSAFALLQNTARTRTENLRFGYDEGSAIGDEPQQLLSSEETGEDTLELRLAGLGPKFEEQKRVELESALNLLEKEPIAGRVFRQILHLRKEKDERALRERQALMDAENRKGPVERFLAEMVSGPKVFPLAHYPVTINDILRANAVEQQDDIVRGLIALGRNGIIKATSPTGYPMEINPWREGVPSPLAFERPSWREARITLTADIGERVAKAVS